MPSVSFNPRPRAGGDLYVSAAICRCQTVSIHAPAWGATYVSIVRSSVRDLFQSTPPRGGRRRVHCWSLSDHTWFQSTPPRGGRPIRPASRTRQATSRFNPRPRVGGDGTSLTCSKSVRNGPLFANRPACGMNRQSDTATGHWYGQHLLTCEPARPRAVASGSHQIIRGSSMSRLGLAPTCPTRRRHSRPSM